MIRTLFASHEFSITNTLSKHSKVFRQGGYQIGATRCWWLSDSWLKFPAENIFLDASSNIGTVQDFMSLKNSQQPLLTVWPDFTHWKVRRISTFLRYSQNLHNNARMLSRSLKTSRYLKDESIHYITPWVSKQSVRLLIGPMEKVDSPFVGKLTL